MDIRDLLTDVPKASTFTFKSAHKRTKERSCKRGSNSRSQEECFHFTSSYKRKEELSSCENIFFNPGSWKPWEFSCNRLMVSSLGYKKTRNAQQMSHNRLIDGRSFKRPSGPGPSINYKKINLDRALIIFSFFFEETDGQSQEKKKELIVRPYGLFI